MSMSEQDLQNVTQNWEWVRDHLREQFPQLGEDDLESGRTDLESFVRTAAQKTGESEDQIRQALTDAGEQARLYR